MQVKPERLGMTEATVRVIQELECPTNHKKSALPLHNVHRRFLPELSKLSAPSDKKLRKEETNRFRTLSKAKVQFLNALKKSLKNPPKLVMPGANGQYAIDIDVRATQVRCILLQTQEDVTDRPMGYWLRKLSDSQRQLVTTHKECLAVVCAI